MSRADTAFLFKCKPSFMVQGSISHCPAQTLQNKTLLSRSLVLESQLRSHWVDKLWRFSSAFRCLDQLWGVLQVFPHHLHEQKRSFENKMQAGEEAANKHLILQDAITLRELADLAGCLLLLLHPWPLSLCEFGLCLLQIHSSGFSHQKLSPVLSKPGPEGLWLPARTYRALLFICSSFLSLSPFRVLLLLKKKKKYPGFY